jgi:hypothetical protein
MVAIEGGDERAARRGDIASMSSELKETREHT